MRTTFNDNFIKDLMIEHKLSIRQFADKVDLHPNHVLELKKNRVKPSIKTMIKLIDAFKISPDRFFLTQ